jgi:UrcA family protein
MFASTSFRTVAGTVGTLIFAGACLFGATSPAVAAEAPQTVQVFYGDLNLASEKGRNLLDARVRQAARNLCYTGARDVRSRTDEVRCYQEAVKSAQPARLATSADFKG